MSLQVTTTIKSILANYIDVAAFRAGIASILTDSIVAINDGVTGGDITVYKSNYTEDVTDYIGIFTLEWFDQATLDAYNAVPEIAAERATLEANFVVTRV